MRDQITKVRAGDGCPADLDQGQPDAGQRSCWDGVAVLPGDHDSILPIWMSRYGELRDIDDALLLVLGLK
jgi:hypothetical protein